MAICYRFDIGNHINNSEPMPNSIFNDNLTIEKFISFFLSVISYYLLFQGVRYGYQQQG